MSEREKQLSTGHETVLPEWADYNGHMNLAYYVVAFDGATDAYKAHVGIDKSYRKRTGHSTFAAELHVVYLQEMMVGEEVDLTTYLLDHDAKRHHFIHSMWRSSDNALVATMEVMSLHIDLSVRKTAPWPDDIAASIAELRGRHALFDPPEQAGRITGLRNGRRSQS